MNIREEIEEREKRELSPYAALSINSKGRVKPDNEDDMRPIYQRDRDRILHCKAFRRLKHKTQVFLAPEGDHYRTRLTHTLEVSQIARTIARSLRLNEDLTEAIALGHDLGHTPYGHSGEEVLNELCKNGFTHYEQSVRIVEFLEKDGRGLNLSLEVIDGIRNHRITGNPMTLEGHCVRIADKIAYINHDVDDSIRAGLFKEADIPREYTDILGHTVRERLNTLIHDVIYQSMDEPKIVMSKEKLDAMMGLRSWMFVHVYRNKIPKAEEGKAKAMIKRLYEYFYEHIDEMPGEYIYYMEKLGEDKERVVCDYISGMSDQYATDLFVKLFVPQPWGIL